MILCVKRDSHKSDHSVLSLWNDNTNKKCFALALCHDTANKKAFREQKCSCLSRA